MSPAKPAVTWYPAHESNFAGAWRGREPIDYIVIHVAQGSWSGTVKWFQNPAARVSAHYVVRSYDGKIAQCVSDRNIAWHAGNRDYNAWSIGIEHEGYIDNPRWFTPEMYHASARLAAFLVRQWGIPPTRSYIIGHNEVPGADHTDPGPWWWWDYYMRLVRRYAST